MNTLEYNLNKQKCSFRNKSEKSYGGENFEHLGFVAHKSLLL